MPTPLDMLASQYDVDTHQVSYTLRHGDQKTDLSDKLGQPIRLSFTGTIYCVNCNTSLKKAYGQGFCYPCFRDSSLASPCIIFPEKCEGHLGRGRDPEWEQKHHVQPHTVYLSDTGAIKVGITRDTQRPKRWIDQGATSALEIAAVPYRAKAGEVEVRLKSFFTDKTQWRTMLTYLGNRHDLVAAADSVRDQLGEYACVDATVWQFVFPMLQVPAKIVSLSLAKTPVIEDRLVGIKGQYLLFESVGVMNVRNHMGYDVEVDF
jgi:hypothetical protein